MQYTMVVQGKPKYIHVNGYAKQANNGQRSLIYSHEYDLIVDRGPTPKLSWSGISPVTSYKYPVTALSSIVLASVEDGQTTSTSLH